MSAASSSKANSAAMNAAFSSSKIAREYKARVTLLQLLRQQGYEVDDYDNFSINDIHAMSVCKRMDMMVTRQSDGARLYVKFQDEDTKLDNVVEDLFVTEEVLRPRVDTLVFVMHVEPNETARKKVCTYFDRDGYFIVITDLANLQFNKLTHTLVPPHIILSDAQIQSEVVERLHLRGVSRAELTQHLPEISRFDAIATCIFMKPGEVCRIERPSATAIVSKYYRICV